MECLPVVGAEQPASFVRRRRDGRSHPGGGATEALHGPPGESSRQAHHRPLHGGGRGPLLRDPLEGWPALEAVAAEVLSAVVPGDQEMGPPMPDEWRTHPEDEKLYSFTDLKKKYKKEFSEAEIKEYWETEMITALQQREEA